MVKLRRAFEAADSSHDSIMYNLAEILKRKGIQAAYSKDKGIVIDFAFDEGYSPESRREGKDWLKDNPGKAFIFKGSGLHGFFCWDISKDSSGKRKLVTSGLKVKGNANLVQLQKMLKAPKSADMELTGRSAKPFSYPEPYIVTNLASPAFHAYLKRMYDHIVADAALALSEVAIPKEKKESAPYIITYDSNTFQRISEGYVEESGAIDSLDWKDKDVQDAIAKAIPDIKIDTGKSTKGMLKLTYKGKNGSFRTQGYMLVFDTDTGDAVPPTSYPIRDKGELTLGNLIDAAKKAVASRENQIANKDTANESFDAGDMAEAETADVPIMPDTEIGSSADELPLSPVMSEVARERFLDKLSKSAIIAQDYEGECREQDDSCNPSVWVYLSPSYSIEQVSDIAIPVCICDDGMVKMPVAAMPDPAAVFGGDTEAMDIRAYDRAVQSYLVNDAPMSSLIRLGTENADDAKAQILDLINSMAEDYIARRTEIGNALEIKGEALLKESRYFIVPADTDLSSGKDVVKYTPIGFTDLEAARNSLSELANSGRFSTDLAILDTHFSQNAGKWEIV